jgi:hypothetical protein
MLSGSQTHHEHSSGHPPVNIDGPPPRTDSASSNRTTKSIKTDTVLIQLSFEGKGKKLLPLDLTKNSDEIIPYLEPYISKMSGGKQLDLSIYEIEIEALKENPPEPESSSLGDFDYSWDAMVEFMRENRASGTSKKAEFRFAIF